MFSSVPALVATWRYHTLTSFDHDLCERSVNMLAAICWLMRLCYPCWKVSRRPSWIFHAELIHCAGLGKLLYIPLQFDRSIVPTGRETQTWCYSPNLILWFSTKTSKLMLPRVSITVTVVFWFFSNTRILSNKGDPTSSFGPLYEKDPWLWQFWA